MEVDRQPRHDPFGEKKETIRTNTERNARSQHVENTIMFFRASFLRFKRYIFYSAVDEFLVALMAKFPTIKHSSN